MKRREELTKSTNNRHRAKSTVPSQKHHQSHIQPSETEQQTRTTELEVQRASNEKSLRGRSLHDHVVVHGNICRITVHANCNLGQDNAPQNNYECGHTSFVNK